MYECVTHDMYVRLLEQSPEVDVRCPALPASTLSPYSKQGISLNLDLG